MPFSDKLILPPGKNFRTADGAPELRLSSQERFAVTHLRTGGDPTRWTWLAVAGAALGVSIACAFAATISGSRPTRQETGASSGASDPLVGTTLMPIQTPRRAPDAPAAPSEIAANPLRWEDLTLMLRAGLGDDDILSETATRQLVVPIGPAQENALRAMGAGPRLLDTLRNRRIYLAPSTTPAPRLVLPAPPMNHPVETVPSSQGSGVLGQATPFDYAARDRKIEDLRRRMVDLDEQVRRIRANPDRHWYQRDYGTNQQQGMDRYLKQLDEQREDLRRQTWALEGR